MFDTLKFARTLRDGGRFTPEQAERLSDALVHRADLGATETELGRKIDESRADFDSNNKELLDDLARGAKPRAIRLVQFVSG